VHKLKYVTK